MCAVRNPHDVVSAAPAPAIAVPTTNIDNVHSALKRDGQAVSILRSTSSWSSPSGARKCTYRSRPFRAGLVFTMYGGKTCTASAIETGLLAQS
jgi:hypothetical protein